MKDKEQFKPGSLAWFFYFFNNSGELRVKPGFEIF
jgi:hypothetical protein